MKHSKQETLNRLHIEIYLTQLLLVKWENEFREVARTNISIIYSGAFWSVLHIWINWKQTFNTHLQECGYFWVRELPWDFFALAAMPGYNEKIVWCILWNFS